MQKVDAKLITVNSIYSGLYRDLEFVSTLPRVCNSGREIISVKSLQIYFCLGFNSCQYYRGVHNVITGCPQGESCL